MEPTLALTDPGLDGVRQRRDSLRAAMGRLEDALAAPAAGQIGLWHRAVGQAAQEVQVHLREHIETTEGPDGFHAEILAAAPRLSHAIEILVSDHLVVAELADKIVVRVQDAATRDDADTVRELGNELLARLSRHRQRGADLIYEAYAYDLGGED